MSLTSFLKGSKEILKPKAFNRNKPTKVSKLKISLSWAFERINSSKLFKNSKTFVADFKENEEIEESEKMQRKI